MKYIIIGTGNICKTYIKAINNIEGSTICGFISRSGNNPSSASGLPVWSSLKDVNCDYNAIIITTPNGLHHKVAIDAARLGKHILTEKPLDITVEAMDKMINACKMAGVKLGVSFQRRMNPDNIAIKKLLDNKSLGKIFSVNLSCKFWRTQDYYDSAAYRGGYLIDGGGPFMQQAVHNLDLYQWFFGKPQSIKSMLGTFMHNIEAEDHGAAIFRHEDGMIGSVVASTATRPGFPARMEVYSDKGYFITLDDKISEWEIDGVPNPKRLVESTINKVSNVATISDSSLHEAVILDFEDSIKNNREPFVTPESAKLTSELVLKIYSEAKN